MYIKPENTFTSLQAPGPLPSGVTELEVRALLGIVIGKNAKQVKEAYALDYVKGYTVVNDVSIPHESVYRPSVKEKARDGFCPIGPWNTNRAKIEYPDSWNIRVSINDKVKLNKRYLALSMELYEFQAPTWKQNNIHKRYKK